MEWFLWATSILALGALGVGLGLYCTAKLSAEPSLGSGHGPGVMVLAAVAMSSNACGVAPLVVGIRLVGDEHIVRELGGWYMVMRFAIWDSALLAGLCIGLALLKRGKAWKQAN